MTDTEAETVVQVFSERDDVQVQAGVKKELLFYYRTLFMAPNLKVHVVCSLIKNLKEVIPAMRELLNPHAIVNSGECAGLSKNLNMGDLCVMLKCFQYRNQCDPKWVFEQACSNFVTSTLRQNYRRINVNEWLKTPYEAKSLISFTYQQNFLLRVFFHKNTDWEEGKKWLEEWKVNLRDLSSIESFCPDYLKALECLKEDGKLIRNGPDLILSDAAKLEVTENILIHSYWPAPSAQSSQIW